jgi:hypothetical protein
MPEGGAVTNEENLIDRWKLRDIERLLKTLESKSQRILDRMPPERPIGAEVDARIADQYVPEIQRDVKTLLLELRFAKERLDRLADRPEPESTGCFRFLVLLGMAFVLAFTIKIHRNVRALVNRPVAIERAQSGVSR